MSAFFVWYKFKNIAEIQFLLIKLNCMRFRTVSIILIFVVFVSSCRKCMRCETTTKSTGAVVDTYPEICGRKATLNTQELTYRSTLPDSLKLNCPRE
jgi:hypothetical protein